MSYLNNVVKFRLRPEFQAVLRNNSTQIKLTVLRRCGNNMIPFHIYILSFDMAAVRLTPETHKLLFHTMTPA